MDNGPSPFEGSSPVASLTTGDGQVTLVEGRTFALSDGRGDMHPNLPHGLFVLESRVLSRWELRLNGQRIEPLAAEVGEPYSATIVGRGVAATGHADAEVVVFRRRDIGGGMREQIEITNHGLDPVSLEVEIVCDSDFASVFEVKERRVPIMRPRSLHLDSDSLRFSSDDPRSGRETVIALADTSSIEPGRAVWRPTIEPGATWTTCIQVVVAMHGTGLEPRFTCDVDDSRSVPMQRLERWRATIPDVTSDLPALDAALRRSGEDLGTLRIFDPRNPDRPVVAAGAPWFMTVFGRDSLITAWMALIADHSLARGVLDTLARFQGSDVDDVTEEEPGKILHEMRFSTAVDEVLDHGDIYYGSIDSTPLFVMLLGELRRWDPDDDLVSQLLPHADRALEWIRDFGDRDGDGYVEYQRRNERGLANQGWKDSWDAVRHADGSLVRPPIALCEVQGYVYAAYLARAHLALQTGDAVTYERYATLAVDLRRRFNEDFWLDELGTFAMGLDADKRPIAALTSNPGHCLWTGIVDPEKAGSVADRLLDDSMFSGWGVRTLASTMPAFNPVSYHNGSVWPHDNAICAAGLARYGYVEHAHRIIEAQLAVAEHQGGRLPELFAGFDRGDLAVPAPYPASCSPQAWAAASPLLWLRTMLRLEPNTPSRQLWIAPALPKSVTRLEVAGVSIGGNRLSIRVEGDDVEIADAPGYEIVKAPRPAVTP